MRPTVGVHVTTHKEARDAAADTRKAPRLRARYYVELVVGSCHADHTRLGFSGTFKALLALHHAFARAYVDRQGDAAGRASLGDGPRPRRSASSSSSSTASQSSASSASSSGVRRFIRHALGLRGDHALLSAGSNLNQLERISWSDASAPSLPPFPAQHKLLVRLEGDGGKDDAKVEARAAALFEYYSQVFNSEDGELYVDFVQQQALRASERKKQTLAKDAPETSEVSTRIIKQLLSHRSRGGGSTASSSDVEFLEPVYVRKSRAHKSAKRSSAAKRSANQRVH